MAFRQMQIQRSGGMSQTFKRDLTEGVEIQDAEGNVMTPEQVTAFLGTLP